jgi:hypothetical protein
MSPLTRENLEQVELLARLGRHRMSKACLHFKQLADVDVKVLEALIAGSVAEVKRRYPSTGDPDRSINRTKLRRASLAPTDARSTSSQSAPRRLASAGRLTRTPGVNGHATHMAMSGETG